ncbi:MAG: hypothetical protein GC164_16470 [Phycisphaera sp.]|nr:hypothetical protein [Phycisphaera sp.]
MHIHLRDINRQELFTVEVPLKNPPSVVRRPGVPIDAPDAHRHEVYLNWDRAFNDEGHLVRCPVCGCRELFARKDFQQITGLVIVVLAATVAIVLFAVNYVIWALTVLGIVAFVDLLIYFFTGKRLVCYRCRSEFKGLTIRPRHPGWELAIGEKYRQGPPPGEGTQPPDTPA